MEIYESATKLASDIKNSKEYRAFQISMKEVKKDIDSENLLKNYKFIQVQMQSYKGVDEGLYNKSKVIYESTHKKVMRNKKLVKYLENEQKFNNLMNNINKILSRAVENDYK